jgi:ElaB/YqjD/DUF883 family membrane-anchored ribosome-binding protein
MPSVPSPHDVISTHQEAINTAAASLQRALQSAREPLQAAYSALHQRSDEVLRGTQDYIEQAPFKALTYALGVGLAVGVVLGVLLCSGGEEREDRNRT